MAIALSGGIDSSALTLFCHQQNIEYSSFSLIGPHITDYEIKRIINYRFQYNLKHFFFYYDYSTNSCLLKNTKNRCFYCKSDLLSGPVNFFSQTHTLVDGTNLTDTLSFRPGIRALKELGINSPLADLEVTKPQVIQLARHLGLKASQTDSRSCILARFAYGTLLDTDQVKRVRQAENYLLEEGLTGFRFRVLSKNDFLLQVEGSQEVIFQQIQPDFDLLCRRLKLFPYKLHFSGFEMITGFMDKNIL